MPAHVEESAPARVPNRIIIATSLAILAVAAFTTMVSLDEYPNALYLVVALTFVVILPATIVLLGGVLLGWYRVMRDGRLRTRAVLLPLVVGTITLIASLAFLGGAFLAPPGGS